MDKKMARFLYVLIKSMTKSGYNLWTKMNGMPSDEIMLSKEE